MYLAVRGALSILPSNSVQDKKISVFAKMRPKVTVDFYYRTVNLAVFHDLGELGIGRVALLLVIQFWDEG